MTWTLCSVLSRFKLFNTLQDSLCIITLESHPHCIYCNFTSCILAGTKLKWTDSWRMSSLVTALNNYSNLYSQICITRIITYFHFNSFCIIIILFYDNFIWHKTEDRNNIMYYTFVLIGSVVPPPKYIRQRKPSTPQPMEQTTPPPPPPPSSPPSPSPWIHQGIPVRLQHSLKALPQTLSGGETAVTAAPNCGCYPMQFVSSWRNRRALGPSTPDAPTATRTK